MAHVCDVHEGLLSTGSIGACYNCSSSIISTSHTLCEPCSQRLNACIVCRQPDTKGLDEEEDPSKEEPLNHHQLVKRLKDWPYSRIYLPAVVEWSASPGVRNYLTSEKIMWVSVSRAAHKGDNLLIDVAVANLRILVPINPRTTYYLMPDVLMSQEVTNKSKDKSFI
jgi:hypothetical protein